MNTEVPFIGRDTELDDIEALIKDWGTYWVVCIDAPGGVGKTRLLHEIYNRYSNRFENVFVTRPIDFDDRSLHIQENLTFAITCSIGVEHFRSYLRQLRDFRAMEQGGVSPERLIQEQEALLRVWHDDFNRFSAANRVIYLFDTFDAIKEAAVLDYLVDSIRSMRMQNVVCLVAGRNARSLYTELRPNLGENAQIINLSPFTRGNAIRYLKYKQEMLRITLETELTEKILLLAQGRPILIDLAVEWRTRGIPLDWVSSTSVDALKSLSNDEMQESQRRFESELVRHIIDTRQLIDWLTLTMAWVFPLDVGMIAELLELSQDEAEHLFTAAQKHVFVKVLPDARIALHDEMRLLVRRFVLPEVDPDGDRRRRDSSLAVTYLQHRIEDQQRQIDELSRVVYPEQDLESQFTAFLKQETLERELWELRINQLHHALFANLTKGFQLFRDLYHRSTNACRFSIRERSIAEIVPYIPELSLNDRYEVSIKRSRHLLEHGMHSEATRILDEVLAGALSPKQHSEALIQMGNARIRAGDILVGLSNLEESGRIARINGLEESIVGRAELEIGWAYRLIGDWDEATRHYMQALELAWRASDRNLEATVRNNLAFTLFFQDHESAIQTCDRAIAIWSELGNRRRLGTGFSNKGCLLYRAGRYEEAHRYYRKALEIFEPEGYAEWIGTVHSWQGITYWAESQMEDLSPDRVEELLEKAEQSLKTAIEIDVARDRAMNLNRLSRVARSKGHFDEAWRLVQASYEESIRNSDFVYEVASLRDMTSMAVENEMVNEYQGFVEKLVSCDRLGNILPDRHAFGGAMLNVGLFGVSIGEKGEGFLSIAEGLKLLAEYGRYANHSFAKALREFEGQVKRLSEQNQKDLLSFLIDYWQEKGLYQKSQYFEATGLFYKLLNDLS